MSYIGLILFTGYGNSWDRNKFYLTWALIVLAAILVNYIVLWILSLPIVFLKWSLALDYPKK